jgi:hypothetical protein
MVTLPSTPQIPAPLSPTSSVQQFVNQNPAMQAGIRVPDMSSPRVDAVNRMATQQANAGLPTSGAQQVALGTVDRVAQAGQRITDIYQAGAAKRAALAAPVAVDGTAGTTASGMASPTVGSATYKPGTKYPAGYGLGNSPVGMTRVDHGYLRPDAAAQLARMKVDFHNATGGNLTLTEGWRSMSDTAKLHAQNPKVNAAPGSSKHNYGTAMDLSGMGSPGSPSFNWMLNNAGRYGFNWNTGRRINEPWHWEYAG